jgi:hypothetical protein
MIPRMSQRSRHSPGSRLPWPSTQIPSSRFSRPRSKPTMTSSPTTTTGTAMRPVLAMSSSRAAASSATFFAANGTP